MSTKSLALTIWLLLFVVTKMALAQPATLAWEQSPTPNVSYRLKWGTTSNNWTGFVDVANPTNHFLNTGPWGAYYFVVLAVTTNNVESLPSNMIFVTNTPAAPMKLKMVPTTNLNVRLEGTTDGAATWIHLATVTKENAPVTIPSASKMMLRTVQLPPLP